MRHKNSLISILLLGSFLALSLAGCKDQQPTYPEPTPTPTVTPTPTPTVTPSPPTPTSPELASDAERMRGRDAYLDGLKQASYTFNPPSPIKVAEPKTVHFWIDPIETPEALADELKRFVPQDASRVQQGRAPWSPRMRATLTGKDFDITPNEPGGKESNGIKDLSSTRRTEWSWDIVPKQPGDALKLHLRLAAVLPPELGEPREIRMLHCEIVVEATLWWWIDVYWDKYWKWILGGLASALASAIAYWWKNRRPKEDGEPPSKK